MPKPEEKWVMPEWMKPYAKHIVNTGGNDIESMVNGHATPDINLPMSTLQACVKSQVGLLYNLHEKGLLPVEPDPARADRIEKGATIRHWQNFAATLGEKLGCLSTDEEILKAVDALKNKKPKPALGKDHIHSLVREDHVEDGNKYRYRCIDPACGQRLKIMSGVLVKKGN